MKMVLHDIIQAADCMVTEPLLCASYHGYNDNAQGLQQEQCSRDSDMSFISRHKSFMTANEPTNVSKYSESSMYRQLVNSAQSV